MYFTLPLNPGMKSLLRTLFATSCFFESCLHFESIFNHRFRTKSRGDGKRRRVLRHNVFEMLNFFLPSHTSLRVKTSTVLPFEVMLKPPRRQKTVGLSPASTYTSVCFEASERWSLSATSAACLVLAPQRPPASRTKSDASGVFATSSSMKPVSLPDNASKMLLPSFCRLPWTITSRFMN